METITTIKQIKEIIEPIPADQFCTHLYENSKGQCCALGHIHKHISGDSMGDQQGFGARKLISEFLKHSRGIYSGIAIINDSANESVYTERRIKDRLMHMINDGIKWEESKSN